MDGYITHKFVKCYIGFCTQGALKWKKKKKRVEELLRNRGKRRITVWGRTR
jgi:hypothetical protein